VDEKGGERWKLGIAAVDGLKVRGSDQKRGELGEPMGKRKMGFRESPGNRSIGRHGAVVVKR